MTVRSRLRDAGLVLTVVAALALLSGTAGFTAATVDRSFAVTVVSDEKATLALDGDEVVVETNSSGDEETVLMDVTNQHSTDLEVKVDADSIHDGPLEVVVDDEVPLDLGPGERDSVEATVNCTDVTSEDLELRVRATGGGAEMDLVRSVEVTCVE